MQTLTGGWMDGETVAAETLTSFQTPQDDVGARIIRGIIGA